MTALEEEPQTFVCMPAHCTSEQDGVKRLGSGETISALENSKGNAQSRLASKEATKDDCPPPWQHKTVQNIGHQLTAVAK